MNSFNPEDISLIFWAFATWDVEADAQLVSALMARARDVAGEVRVCDNRACRFDYMTVKIV